MNRHKPNLNQSVKTALCIAAASLLQIATALAQPYNIDWHCLAGGGGDGTGGDYTLNSTVGQPAGDVGVGGDYTLETGFWSVVDAIQSPDAPWLTITVTNGQITLSWPKPAEGWVLQRTPALAPQSGGTAWSDISPPYPTNPTHVLFAEPWTAGARYYRLHKP